MTEPIETVGTLGGDEGKGKETKGPVPAEPSSSRCDVEVFHNGEPIGMISADGAAIIEAIVVRMRTYAPKAKIDWFFAGGRGIVKALGDIPSARTAFAQCVRIDVRALP